MSPFRKHHLLAIFDRMDQTQGPIDLILSYYFRQHKAIGSKDRKIIAETVFRLIKQKGLLDYFCSSPKSWLKRLELLESESFLKGPSNPSIPLHVRCSFPKDLFLRLEKGYGPEKAFSLAMLSQKQASVTVRANTLKTSRDELLRNMREYLPEKCRRSPVFQTEAFKNGLFEMQDEASQLAALSLGAKPGEKILDYCSGSGGKTLAFAPDMKNTGVVYLHDIRPNILLQARKRLKRAGLQNIQFLGPKEKEKKKRLRGKMDRVFVDVPCTGTGTYRRNPDLKWKYDEKMLEELLLVQEQIFEEALAYLAPGGVLVYATCSLLREENEMQIEKFIRKYNVSPVASPFSSLSFFEEADGFFAASLTR